MRCANCGTEVPEKFKFCPECGTSVASTASRDSDVERDGAPNKWAYGVASKYMIIAVWGQKEGQWDHVSRFTN